MFTSFICPLTIFIKLLSNYIGQRLPLIYILIGSIVNPQFNYYKKKYNFDSDLFFSYYYKAVLYNYNLTQFMLILGSSSPRRQQLLSYLTKDFKVLTADLDEDSYIPQASDSQDLVIILSQAKAEKIIKSHCLSNQIILTADTIVSLKTDQPPFFRVIGKPQDLTQAYKTLTYLSGKTHQVYTGFTIINQKTNHQITDFSLSFVTFKHLSPTQISAYIDRYQPLDKAGSYAIQQMGPAYIKQYLGSLFGIIGLPLEKIAPILNSYSISINPRWQKEAAKEFIFGS